MVLEGTMLTGCWIRSCYLAGRGRAVQLCCVGGRFGRLVAEAGADVWARRGCGGCVYGLYARCGWCGGGTSVVAYAIVELGGLCSVVVGVVVPGS